MFFKKEMYKGCSVLPYLRSSVIVISVRNYLKNIVNIFHNRLGGITVSF